jgi:hypothetical protein
MFYGKFADQRDNQIDSPNRYNVEGNNSLSLGRQPELCWKSGYKITWFLKTNQLSVMILPVNFYIAFLYDYNKLFGLIIVLVQSSSLSFLFPSIRHNWWWCPLCTQLTHLVVFV